MVGCWLHATELQNQLLADLEKDGTTQFSTLEMALIAEGTADPETLKDLVSRYNAKLEKLTLSPRQMKQKGTRKAQIIQKNLQKIVKDSQVDATGFAQFLESGNYTNVIINYIFVDVGERSQLEPADYQSVAQILDQGFFKNGTPSLREIAAGHFTYHAYQHSEKSIEDTIRLLRISTLLEPKSEFGIDTIGKLLYNKTLELYRAEQFEPAARLASSAASRFPQLGTFSDLCFNIGIKMFQSPMEQNQRELVTELAHLLKANTGAHQSKFENAMDTRQYNHGAILFNKKQYAQAIAALEQVKNPPDPAEHKRVLTGSYQKLAEQLSTTGDEEGYQAALAKLGELDPNRADLTRQRLRQLELKAVDESGDLEQALKMASQNLETDLDRQNYQSIMTRHVKNLAKSGAFEKAFKILDGVPQKAAAGTQVEALKVNTYHDWIESFKPEDFKNRIAIFKKVFADKGLKLKGENQEIFRHNYANALHREITLLIEERKFTEADKKSRQALEMSPEHEQLNSQRNLIDTILKRVGNQ